MVSDSFAPQEVISYEIPHQRVFIRLPVLLWLLHLVVILDDPEVLKCSVRILSLAESVSCTLPGSLLDFHFCEYTATSLPALRM